MANKKLLSSLVVVAVLAAAMLVVLLAPSGKSEPSGKAVDAPRAGKTRIADVGHSKKAGSQADADDSGDSQGMEEGEGEDSGVVAEEKSEEEKLADQEEALVDAFDDMTDKFREIDDGKEVSMDDVKKFHEQFRKVPKARKEECLQRALNLLPDDNIMLLAGILMDKEEDKELLELVFNDILNRDESVKQVLLKEIYKDKSHPCWADTAWILDVTGKESE